MMQRIIEFLKNKPSNTLEDTVSSLPFLIVGLGNPGREYRASRHNVGFMVVDRLARNLDVSLGRMQMSALTGQANYQNNRVILVKPQTFMNLSGQAVAPLMRFYKVPIDQLLVIHDDVDLPFGTLRIRPDGGSGGQKGLGSIIERLGTQVFPRLRFGIGRPPGRMDTATYVLHEFSSAEQELLSVALDRAAEAATTFISAGLDKAMNQYNGEILKS